MITEQYVEFETAKLLKEKGFNEDCMFVVNLDSNGILPCSFGTKNSEIDNKNIVTIPSQSLVMRWLREEKHFYIQIMLDSWALGGHSGYYIVIQDINSEFKEISPIIDDNPDLVFFETYEQAAESAIKYCLENLI